jgi:hypothetical protein
MISSSMDPLPGITWSERFGRSWWAPHHGSRGGMISHLPAEQQMPITSRRAPDVQAWALTG